MLDTTHKYGMLTINYIDRIEYKDSIDGRGRPYKAKKVFWRCTCDCGNTIVADEKGLRLNITTNCGCQRIKQQKEQAKQRLLGKSFGWLEVIEFDHDELVDTNGYKKTKYFWKCKCNRCGNITIVNGSALTSGHAISCGCYKRDNISNGLHITHNLTHHRLYRIHDGMIDRCYRPNGSSYERYGARGIKISDEWYTPGVKGNPGLVNFITWAYANGYYDQPKDTPRKDILSIERVDNDGDYTPDNCIWIPLYKQAENTSNNHKLYYNGNWCNIENLKSISPTPGFIRNALRNGWSDNAISYALMHQDLQIHKHNGKYYDKDGFPVLIPKYKD